MLLKLLLQFCMNTTRSGACGAHAPLLLCAADGWRGRGVQLRAWTLDKAGLQSAARRPCACGPTNSVRFSWIFMANSSSTRPRRTRLPAASARILRDAMHRVSRRGGAPINSNHSFVTMCATRTRGRKKITSIALEPGRGWRDQHRLSVPCPNTWAGRCVVATRHHFRRKAERKPYFTIVVG